VPTKSYYTQLALSGDLTFCRLPSARESSPRLLLMFPEQADPKASTLVVRSCPISGQRQMAMAVGLVHLQPAGRGGDTVRSTV